MNRLKEVTWKLWEYLMMFNLIIGFCSLGVWFTLPIGIIKAMYKCGFDPYDLGDWFFYGIAFLICVNMYHGLFIIIKEEFCDE